MSALLLDTNTVIWFMAQAPMRPAALEAIAKAQHQDSVFVSPISAWEAALALRKRRSQPDLGGRDATEWFQAVLRSPGFRLAQPTRRIALEAARVPAVFGHGDPGDCFLIATARTKRIPIVTRDRRMLRLSVARSDYLQTIAC
jgi:PIN domain nuclease of toxin-antitoxin system